MSILDILLGKKVFIETKHLGTFSARIRKNNNSRNIVWSSTIEIENYSKEIVILLEGDILGPEQEEVENTTWIIQNLKLIEKEMLNEIDRNYKLNEKFKHKNLNELRLSCIYPRDKNLNTIELSFESTSDDTTGTYAIIQNQKIIEVG
ncbi:MAG: hypothetical protein H6Q19_1615 [Bacteroidetes bacterium]|nr:hypothetical protein [Bacteroidota bacterium]